jgi:hypothetical protein
LAKIFSGWFVGLIVSFPKSHLSLGAGFEDGLIGPISVIRENSLLADRIKEALLDVQDVALLSTGDKP